MIVLPLLLLLVLVIGCNSNDDERFSLYRYEVKIDRHVYYSNEVKEDIGTRICLGEGVWRYRTGNDIKGFYTGMCRSYPRIEVHDRGK